MGAGSSGLLVLVGSGVTPSRTIEFAIDGASSADGTPELHLVQTVPRRRSSPSRAQQRVIERAEAVAREVAPEGTPVHTALLGLDRYLADPTDHVAVLESYAAAEGIDRVVVDPSYSVDATAPTLQPVESALSASGLTFDRAPADEGPRRLSRPMLIRAGAVFVLTFGFYLALGDPGSAFDLLTGAAAGVLAAGLFRNVTFETTPNPVRAPLVILRGVCFVPYLLWEIAKANVQFAYVVLHPSLPIDPWLDRVDAAVDDGISVTGLANSLTLTPGTLTVEADGSELLVHSLDGPTREEFLSGARERAIGFVFRGRAALETPGPLDRGDATRLAGPGHGVGPGDDDRSGGERTDTGRDGDDGPETEGRQ